VGAQGTTARLSTRRGERRLYRDRSGFPGGIEAARGAAKDFKESTPGRESPTLEPPLPGLLPLNTADGPG